MEDQRMQRLNTTIQHLNVSAGIQPDECSGHSTRPAPYIPPTEKELKWNGWGYDDTGFVVNDDGKIVLTGNKYSLSGKVFPKFRPFIESQMEGISVDEYNPPQETIELPPPILNHEFLKAVEGKYARIETDRMICVRHAHGHTAQEIYNLRYGTFERIPDVVIWPACHEQVQTILDLASQYNVVIVPFGGGTSVTEALVCPTEEKRMIVSLDMKMMNRIKWVDRESLLGCIEAGIVGKELEARLGMMGLCFGHEPDSHEFSTLGGWVATRASGMKKNMYGNIEDLMIHVKVATPVGTIDRTCNVPRLSVGPDIQQVILGSEGILGVITEVTIKLQPLPQTRAYGAIAFKDFETGFNFMREVALKRLQPASLRLMDNQQFQMGQSITPEENPKLEYVKHEAQRMFLTHWAKFDLNEMCACTALFEGDEDAVALQQKKVYAIAAKYGGIKAGEASGMKGYFLTYMIAYLRDYGFGYWLIGESFETSVPWANVLTLCRRVQQRVIRSGEEKGLPYKVECSYRVTQLYDTGAAVYFYFGFIFRGVEDPVRKFAEIEAEARDEVLACGGSLSHHHGVGKLRKSWMTQTVSPVGVEVLRGIKKTLDPNNILGIQNLIDI